MNINDIPPPSWGVVSWAALILFGLYVWRKLIGISLTEFVSAVISEFSQLLNARPTAASINALGLVALVLLTLLVGFSNSFWSIFTLSSSDIEASQNEKVWMVIILISFIVFKSLVCVALCRKND